METLIKADIFFFVSTVCAIVVSIFLAVCLFKMSRFFDECKTLAKKISKGADEVSEEAEELVEDVRNSFLFRFFFPPHKKKKKVSHKK